MQKKIEMAKEMSDNCLLKYDLTQQNIIQNNLEVEMNVINVQDLMIVIKMAAKMPVINAKMEMAMPIQMGMVSQLLG